MKVIRKYQGGGETVQLPDVPYSPPGSINPTPDIVFYTTDGATGANTFFCTSFLEQFGTVWVRSMQDDLGNAAGATSAYDLVVLHGVDSDEEDFVAELRTLNKPILHIGSNTTNFLHLGFARNAIGTDFRTFLDWDNKVHPIFEGQVTNDTFEFFLDNGDDIVSISAGNMCPGGITLVTLPGATNVVTSVVEEGADLFDYTINDGTTFPALSVGLCLGLEIMGEQNFYTLHIGFGVVL